LLIQVGTTEIALGQQHSDSCICYTDAMDIKAITCIRAQATKDSIISNYGLQIFNFKTVIKNQDTILKDDEITIAKLEDENQEINLRLVSAVRNIKLFGVGGVVIGAVAVLLLLK